MFAELRRKEAGILRALSSTSSVNGCCLVKFFFYLPQQQLSKVNMVFCKPWVSYIILHLLTCIPECFLMICRTFSCDSQGLRRSSTDPVAMKSIEVSVSVGEDDSIGMPLIEVI